MPRTARAALGGVCYHVMNRGNAKTRIFLRDVDYLTFTRLIELAGTRVRMRVLAYCLMPNHFHLVLWPFNGPDMSRYLHWLLTTHAMRHHRRYETVGRIWQGRFKAFPIQQDHHLVTVLRYVERNPLRAGLVARAEDWPWSSLRRRHPGSDAGFLHGSPAELPGDWQSLVNQPETPAEEDAMRNSITRGSPFGDPVWRRRAARELGLEDTLRPRGRPRK